MFKKTCPYCSEDSYSASGGGQWICPYCDKNITDVHLETVCTKALCADKGRKMMEDKESKDSKA